MADPAFEEMEVQAESLIPRRPLDTRNRDDKLIQPRASDEETVHAETTPLLGPPVLINGPEKRWYNTPSVALAPEESTNLRYFGSYQPFC